MSTYALLTIYSLAIILVSLLGGWLPSRIRMTHTGTQVMMSFVAGLMLGVACYHLLPHAIMTLPGESRVDEAVWWMMMGLLLMFVLLRAFHFHQHSPIEQDSSDCESEHSHGHGPSGVSAFSWTGVALGLALHTLIDGVALGAAMQAGASGNAPLGLVGLGVFAAIFLHKPLDSMSITSLMIAGGWNARSRLLVNLAFSVMCPLGALLFFAGIEYIPVDANWLVGITLAFSAGVFICISLSDLLPEVQFHSHDRARLTIALLAGVVAAYGVGLMEPEHDDFSHSPAVESHDRH
jgi:zinc and cadmium transporter|tara:strand:- start:10773 stop:11651 length:879 start_codon:yes stop_codon:yes gene_type:complete